MAKISPNTSVPRAVSEPTSATAVKAASKATSKAAKLHDRFAWKYAKKAFRCAKQYGLQKTEQIVVIDYSLPSTEKRLWVVNPSTEKVSYNEYVAHGVNTGDVKSEHFSNVNMSKKSSLGVFYTAETYSGKHGYSLRLDGQELGINDLARRRAIVIHGAKYVNDNFIKKFGRLGRSWGCPALDVAVSSKIIQKIQGGTMVFAYYPDKNWIKQSDFLNCKG